jgi:hypothetical protein
MKTLIQTLAIALAFSITTATITEAASLSKNKGKSRSSVKKARYKRSSKKLKRVDVSRCPGISMLKIEL